MLSNVQIPWNWYIVRASALVAFLLLYFSIFVGTISCLPGIGKYFLRLRSLNFHCWISLQALVFVIIHAVALLFHKLIPFHSNFEPVLVGLGTIGFYLMFILVATSYARKYVSQKFWRAVHFLNIGLYIVVIIHAFYLGTDLKSGLLRGIFIWANGLLLLMLFINLVYRVWAKIKQREISCEVPVANFNENLRQSRASFRQKRDYQNFRRRI